MKGAKTPGERRKKIHDKFSHHMSVLRMDCLRKPRYNSTSNNVEQKENIPFVDNSISRQSSQYQPQNSQDMLCFQSLVAMTPSTLFVPLDPGPAMRVMQTPYNSSPLTSMQGQILTGNNGHVNNYPLNDLTTNFAGYQTVHQHQNQQNSFNLGNLFEESYFDPIPNTTNNLVAPNPPLPVDITLQNIVSPSVSSYDMPSRPNPPSFIDGPQYFQASEDFLSSFGKADVDNSKFITLDELKVFLQNKDGSSFNDATAMTIMNMFDKSKCSEILLPTY